MSGQFVRCIDCRTLYKAAINVITDEPVWIRPPKTPGLHGQKACNHTNGIETWSGTRWDARPLGAHL